MGFLDFLAFLVMLAFFGLILAIPIGIPIGIITGIVVIGPSVLLGLIPFVSSPLKISISVIFHVVALFGSVLFIFIYSLEYYFDFELYLISVETMTLIYGITIGLFIYAGIYLWRNGIWIGGEQYLLLPFRLGISGGIVLLSAILSTFGFSLLFMVLSDNTFGSRSRAVQNQFHAFTFNVFNFDFPARTIMNDSVYDYLFATSIFFGMMMYGVIAGLLTYSGAYVWNNRTWTGSRWYFLLLLRFGVSGVIVSLGWILLAFGIFFPCVMFFIYDLHKIW